MFGFENVFWCQLLCGHPITDWCCYRNLVGFLYYFLIHLINVYLNGCHNCPNDKRDALCRFGRMLVVFACVDKLLYGSRPECVHLNCFHVWKKKWRALGFCNFWLAWYILCAEVLFSCTTVGFDSYKWRNLWGDCRSFS